MKTKQQPITRETVASVLGGFDLSEIETDDAFEYARNRIIERLGYEWNDGRAQGEVEPAMRAFGAHRAPGAQRDRA
jgi:hypothetical protein